jgi:putative transposase
MKDQYNKTGVMYWCGMFGISRQAYYKSRKQHDTRAVFESTVLEEVRKIRAEQQKVGTLKLLESLNNEAAKTGIAIGRDSLYKLLKENGLLVRKRKKYKPITTDGNGESIYKDLRKGFTPDEPNQLWSADITYLSLRGVKRHCYATFVVDEYSHLITGHTVSMRMTAESVVEALQIGIDNQQITKGQTKLIHHSDRGSQFKSECYQKTMADYGITASMTQKGSPYENPVSERLNGIIKNELIGIDYFNNLEHAKLLIDNAVHVYNNRRLHSSCDYLTPAEAHQRTGLLLKRWHPKVYKKHTV